MSLLADVPKRFPADRLALVHRASRWTFGELHDCVDAWGQTLAARGVRPDELVAFALPNGPDFIALTFGIYRAGATPAPLSPALPPVERDSILELLRPALFLTADDRPDPEAPRITVFHVAASWKACTSGGSTGTPKVIVDARPAAFEPGTGFIAIPADSVVLLPGPLYHNAPFSAAVFALWRGSTVVTMDRFDAQAALDLIERERVYWSIMVPTMLNRIMAPPEAVRDARDLSSWHLVVHTTAPMPEWLKRAWIEWRGPDHIWEVYGATEGVIRCWIGGREWLERPGSVGRPISGGQLKIFDDCGAEVPTGSAGEVYALPEGGAGTTYRYIGADRRATPDGWESVGDCGHVDADGYLYLADRRSDLIISGGINIWPAEVEAALLRHSAIRSCSVHGVDDADLGQRVHAVIESDEAITLAGVGEFLRDHLVRSKWPRSLSIQPTPVRDDAGKFRKAPSKAAP